MKDIVALAFGISIFLLMDALFPGNCLGFLGALAARIKWLRRLRFVFWSFRKGIPCRTPFARWLQSVWKTAFDVCLQWFGAASTNYTADPNIVAYYNFETMPGFMLSGNGIDNVGDYLTHVPTQDTTYFKRGASSAFFTVASTQYLSCSNAHLSANFPGGKAATSFTIMCWVRIPSAPVTYVSPMGCRTGGSNASWYFAISSAGKPQFTVFDSLNNQYDSQSAKGNGSTNNIVPMDGTWHHLAGVFDSVGLTATLFLDGMPGPALPFLNTLKISTANFTIGQAGGPAFYMGGNVDEAAVFNRVLSQAEICEIIGYGLDGSVTPTFETYYACMGGDGTNPTDGTTTHAWDISNLAAVATWQGVYGQTDSKIGPGDTIIMMHNGGNFRLAGGNVLLMMNGGIAAKRLTIEGDGSAIIDGNDATTTTIGSWTGVNYVTFENLEIMHAVSYNVCSVYGCDFWTLHNCHVHHTTNLDNLFIWGGKNWLVQYCELDHPGTTSGTTHNTYCGSDSSGDGTMHCANCVFEYNYYHDNQNGTGNQIQFNGNNTNYTGMVIRYNWFDGAGYSVIEEESSDGTQIYGNIIVINVPGTGFVDAFEIGGDASGTAVPHNIQIWNNTIYGNFDDGLYFTEVKPGNVGIFKNNIFYRTTSLPSSHNFIGMYLTGSTLSDSDYNLYFSSYATANFYGVDNSPQVMNNLSNWQSVRGQDMHSTQSVDPMFTDPINGDFTLQPNSPAKGTGLTGGPTYLLHPATKKSNFGRYGNVILQPVGTIPSKGAYAYPIFIGAIGGPIFRGNFRNKNRFRVYAKNRDAEEREKEKR